MVVELHRVDLGFLELDAVFRLEDGLPVDSCYAFILDRIMQLQACDDFLFKGDQLVQRLLAAHAAIHHHDIEVLEPGLCEHVLENLDIADVALVGLVQDRAPLVLGDCERDLDELLGLSVLALAALPIGPGTVEVGVRHVDDHGLALLPPAEQGLEHAFLDKLEVQGVEFVKGLVELLVHKLVKPEDLVQCGMLDIFRQLVEGFPGDELSVDQQQYPCRIVTEKNRKAKPHCHVMKNLVVQVALDAENLDAVKRRCSRSLALDLLPNVADMPLPDLTTFAVVFNLRKVNPALRLDFSDETHPWCV